MTVDKPKYLKTNRLTLKPIQMSDLETIQKYSTDEEWHRYLDFHTNESVKDFVEKSVNTPWNENVRFSIFLKNKPFKHVLSPGTCLETRVLTRRVA